MVALRAKPDLIGEVRRCFFANARDWARFGLLYPHDGIVGGRRLLPEGWVDFSARATLAPDYGAGFWTNRSDHERAKDGVNQRIPRDAFYAFASLGQMVYDLAHRAFVSATPLTKAVSCQAHLVSR